MIRALALLAVFAAHHHHHAHHAHHQRLARIGPAPVVVIPLATEVPPPAAAPARAGDPEVAPPSCELDIPLPEDAPESEVEQIAAELCAGAES